MVKCSLLTYRNNMEKMLTIVLLKGLPASGKTFWTINEMKQFPGKYKRVNKDLLRTMLDGDIRSPKNESFIQKVREHIVERALYDGMDVILDDTNFGEGNWESMCFIAKKIGNVRVFEKYFPISVKEAIARNAGRPNPVPDHVIEGMYDKYIKHTKVEIRDSYFSTTTKVSRVLAPSILTPAIIVDIDGTLALNESGRDYYDNTRVIEDTLNWDIAALVRTISEVDYKVLIVTGRPEECRTDTVQWLKDNSVEYEELFMRKTGDYRRDKEIKREIYDMHISPKYHVVYVLDDRPSVSNMFRHDLGLTVLQVDDHLI